MSKTDYTKIDKIIANHLAGKSSTDEINKLEAWILKSEDNRMYYNQMKNLWDSTEFISVSTENALAKVMRAIGSDKKRITFWGYWQRVAAVLLIPLLVITNWITFDRGNNHGNAKPVINTIFTTKGTCRMLELPDGSKVWLNSGASLQFPEQFETKCRNVTLVGEAYFEVHSDVNSPFFVNTSSVRVKATGTRFNVMSYKEDSTLTVTLVEGKVAILNSSSDKHSGPIIALQPNQHMEYNKATGEYSVNYDDSYKYIAWKDGKLIFRNDLLTEVARRVGIQYDVDIEILGEQIKKYRYRATFENESLDELLRLLKISSPIDYVEIKPSVQTDGSFSKRKIILFASGNGDKYNINDQE